MPDTRIYYANDRGDRQLQMTVKASDTESLAAGSAIVESAIRSLPETANVNAGTGLDRPEIRVRPRFDEAPTDGEMTADPAEGARQSSTPITLRRDA